MRGAFPCCLSGDEFGYSRFRLVSLRLILLRFFLLSRVFVIGLVGVRGRLAGRLVSLTGRLDSLRAKLSVLGYWVVGWRVLRICDEVRRCCSEDVMAMISHAGLVNVGVGFVLRSGSTGGRAARIGSSTRVTVFCLF